MLAPIRPQREQRPDGEIVPVGVRLGHDDPLPVLERGPDRVRPPGDEAELAPARRGGAEGDQLGRADGRAHRDPAVRAGSRHAGSGGEPRDDGGVEGGVGPAPHRPRSRHVDVGHERGAEPVHHRLTEAPDHQPDPHRGRDRDDERGEGDRGP